MPVFSLKRPKKSNTAWSEENLWARFCYYFPQYTFNEAKKLPFKRIMQMLSVVDKERALDAYHHCLAAMAPHSKKPDSVLKYFKQLIEK